MTIYPPGSFISTHPEHQHQTRRIVGLPTAPAHSHSHSHSQFQPPSPPPYKDTPSPVLASNNSNKPVSPPDSVSSSDDSSDMLRRCVICPGSRSVASYIHNCIFHSRKRVSQVWEGVVWFLVFRVDSRLDMDPGGGIYVIPALPEVC